MIKYCKNCGKPITINQNLPQWAKNLQKSVEEYYIHNRKNTSKYIYPTDYIWCENDKDIGITSVEFDIERYRDDAFLKEANK